MIDKKYDESSIKILEGLEHVRKRPGMYIGSTDSRGLHHLVWEIVDNSIDEILNNYGNEVTITICQDNSIKVSDNGRGMPYKLHESGVPTTQVIFTILNAGGKFTDEGGYKSAGGLHGVGSSVVNALSSFLEVTVYRDGQIHRQRFENGGQIIRPLEYIGESKKTGTEVWFKPDSKVFTTTIYNYETIKERVRESAFLLKNLTVKLIDERNKHIVKEEFKYSDGLKEYVSLLNQDKNSITEVIQFENTYGNDKRAIEVDVAFQYTESYSETIVSFVNNVRTKDGGTHESGFKSGLTRVINDFARSKGYLKEKDSNLEGTDIREGISAVISVKIRESILEFEGQTKGKLGTPDAKNALETTVYDKMIIFLEENKTTAIRIIEKAIRSFKVREAARKARDDARNIKLKSKKDVQLTGKLTPAQTKNRDKNELFIVEGDSAGGSAKQGRNRTFQAILPLRGKVINTEKADSEKALGNEEIFTLIYSIGAGFGKEFDIKKSNFNKIIIMTDADNDGAHIQILLLTFFFKYMKELIENGKIYLAMPPLYRVNANKTIYYAYDNDELNAIINNKTNYTLQRFKGLGEMNSDQLWHTTMDPESRKLIQVNMDNVDEVEKNISILMGDDVKSRREWIENNIDFDVIDEFQITEKHHE